MSDLIRAVTGGQVASARDGVRAPAVSASVAQPVQEKAVAHAEAPSKPRFDPEKFQEMLKEIIERLNQQMKDGGRDLGFSVDDRINTFIVTVKNTNTGEVIRQIPSEVVVNMAHSIEDLKGVIFNGKF